MGCWIKPLICCLLVDNKAQWPIVHSNKVVLYTMGTPTLVIALSSQLYSSELWGALPLPSEVISLHPKLDLTEPGQTAFSDLWSLCIPCASRWWEIFSQHPESLGSQILSQLGSSVCTLYLITKKLSEEQMALFIWVYQLCILKEYQSEKHKFTNPRFGDSMQMKRRDLMPAVAA